MTIYKQIPNSESSRSKTLVFVICFEFRYSDFEFMIFEKSAGAIVFKEEVTSNKEKVTREYLVLAYPRIEKPKEIIWGFPKGKVEAGEGELETARREVGEETGLSEFSLVEGFKEKEKYIFKKDGEFVNKTVVYFLARTTSREVKISFEHKGFEWLSFEDTLEKLSFKNAKEILKKAEDFLNGQSHSPQQKLII